MDRIRQTNQLSSSAVAVAEQNPKKLGWKGENVKRQRSGEREKRRKRRQLVTDSLPKRGAKPCHKCDILASQTVRR